MNVPDLKEQLLRAIESSGMQAMFPKFCSAFHKLIEGTEPSAADADELKVFIEIFRNPDEWLAFMTERSE